MIASVSLLDDASHTVRLMSGSLDEVGSAIPNTLLLLVEGDEEGALEEPSVRVRRGVVEFVDHDIVKFV